MDNSPVAFGKYRLLRKVAQGGMAEIFLAHDEKGQICAIKRILPHLAHEESFIRMFIDEARIVSHLDHPNIAGVFDQGKHEGYYFIAMEFVQGHSLLALAERAKQMKASLPRGLLAYVVAELLAGLGCAHSARDAKGRHLGIVHRDVTPQNVLISYDGEVKLIDFGVAKARARLTQTEAGFTKGKLSYMSPEQARGEELDGRSDLFSVGIILYELTTGTRLFNKEGPGGILGAIVNDPIPPPSLKAKDYPRELEAAAMKGLAKEVSARWQSAEEMRDALLRFAKKEKPAPGRARLQDLVRDIFGEPESQKYIDAVKGTTAPTPPEVQAHGLVRGAPVRVGKSTIDPLDERPERSGRIHKSVVAQVRDDETRMLRPDYELEPKPLAKKKLEVTGDNIPALAVPIPQSEVRIPEIAVPLRVRIARFLMALADDLRLSWRAHRRRWVSGLGAAAGLLVLLVALQAGLVGRIGSFMGGAAERARELQRSAGLGEAVPDAGIRPTVLRLVSEPPGAAIIVDGMGMGTVTPHDVEGLPLGRPLAVSLSLPGYRPFEEVLTLAPDEGVREVTFTLERQLAAVRVESDPPGAEVVLDGKRTGKTTPVVLGGLPTGAPINVRVVQRGRLAQSTAVVLADGEERLVAFALPVDESKVAAGRIAVSSSPSGCRVWVDDQPAGQTPLEGHEVRPGAHMVKVACENHGEESQALSVRSGETARASFSLRPTVFGYLTVTAIPAEGSELTISGQPVRLPVEFLKVTPGRHMVRVVNRRLNLSREIAVDVGPNARVSRQINLYQ